MKIFKPDQRVGRRTPDRMKETQRSTVILPTLLSSGKEEFNDREGKSPWMQDRSQVSPGPARSGSLHKPPFFRPVQRSLKYGPKDSHPSSRCLSAPYTSGQTSSMGMPGLCWAFTYMAHRQIKTQEDRLAQSRTTFTKQCGSL